MELSSFSETVITRTFIREGGESLSVQINIDAFLPEYFEYAEKRLGALEKNFAKKAKKTGDKATALGMEKQLLELLREAHAELLTLPVALPGGGKTCVLKGWDLTENGIPLPANKETLVRLPPKGVEGLWEFCRNAAKTVKKKGGRGGRGDLGEYAQWLKGTSRTRPDWIDSHALSISFGIPPWELNRVALHWQEERRIYLMARFEAQVHKQDDALKKGAQNINLFLPEF